MFKASAGKTLPTSIIGSLPRPSWYTAVLGARSFLEALVNSRYREQSRKRVNGLIHRAIPAREVAREAGTIGWEIAST
jgi:hypothetical protein